MRNKERGCWNAPQRGSLICYVTFIIQLADGRLNCMNAYESVRLRQQLTQAQLRVVLGLDLIFDLLETHPSMLTHRWSRPLLRLD